MAQRPRKATRRIAISILAGGLSTRMGRDKSGLRLGRRTLLGHVRATAEHLGLPIRVIHKDVVPRCGPLGGIYTALQSSHACAELFLSCDMPFVSVRLLRELLQKSGDGERAVCVSHAGRAGFPLLVPVFCFPAVEQQIAVKVLSIQSLIATLRVRRVRAKADEVLNINTPDELRKAKDLLTRMKTIRAG